MKKIYSIFLAAALCFSAISCSKWLDVLPTDIVDGDELFEEGSGYRNALNGIYKQMSSADMYGQEFTWGMAEAMGQTYNPSYFSTHAYANMAKYSFTDKKSEAVIESIWSTTYNTIANCNSIIVRIGDEPDSKFKGGLLEKNLILGEALAVRALLHFEILTYFAPSLAQKHDGVWIPYFEIFPNVAGDYVSVEKCLELCIRDLKQAQTLVGSFDSQQTPTNHLVWMKKEHRYSTDGGHGEAATDVFYGFRGYRMNYAAVSAVMARIYSYAGEFDLASAEAQKVIDYIIDVPNATLAFTFTTNTDVKGDYKMSDDLIFCVSTPKIVDNYHTFTTTSSSRNIYMARNYAQNFDSESDYRKTALLNISGRTAQPLKYTIPVISNPKTNPSLDMMPIIRLSEMHYIQAEYYASLQQFDKATASLEVVRKGRNCGAGLLEGKINSAATFKAELLKEVRREFPCEGRAFYYFKKYGEKLVSNMTDESYYFPLPDTETVN